MSHFVRYFRHVVLIEMRRRRFIITSKYRDIRKGRKKQPDIATLCRVLQRLEKTKASKQDNVFFVYPAGQERTVMSAEIRDAAIRGSRKEDRSHGIVA
jgi:hypothetical protein